MKNLLDHFQTEYFFKPSAIACYSAGSFGGVRVFLIEIFFVLLAIFLGSRLAVYIENNQWIEFFILVVLLASGKMLTLLFYRLLAKKIKSKSSVITGKINYIIVTIMVGLAAVQLVKILVY